jgi:hypothetical protein
MWWKYRCFDLFISLPALCLVLRQSAEYYREVTSILGFLRPESFNIKRKEWTIARNWFQETSFNATWKYSSMKPAIWYMIWNTAECVNWALEECSCVLRVQNTQRVFSEVTFFFSFCLISVSEVWARCLRRDIKPPLLHSVSAAASFGTHLEELEAQIPQIASVHLFTQI